jgi:galactonate dehydratase
MIQEVFQDYDADWTHELVLDPISIKNGSLLIPEGPGLGIELDLDVVTDHAYSDKDDVDTINLFQTGWEDRAADLR